MILVNGVAAESIAATDRGLAYGDGVFRTLLLRDGAPVCWDRHHRKLAADCAALNIPCPSDTLLAEELGRAAAGPRVEVAKVIITRGSGARGYAPPRPCRPTRIVMTSPMPVYPAEFAGLGVEVRLCRTRVGTQPRLAGVKHLNRLENVLARAEWDDPAIPEGLVMDEAANIVGGTMSNLFLVEGGALVTPDLARCGVAGVTRGRIMDAAAARGIACREALVSQQRLMDAEEALIVNSVIGAWTIKACAGRAWRAGQWTARVREWLDEEGR